MILSGWFGMKLTKRDKEILKEWGTFRGRLKTD